MSWVQWQEGEAGCKNSTETTEISLKCTNSSGLKAAGGMETHSCLQAHAYTGAHTLNLWFKCVIKCAHLQCRTSCKQSKYLKTYKLKWVKLESALRQILAIKVHLCVCLLLSPVYLKDRWVVRVAVGCYSTWEEMQDVFIVQYTH